MSLPLKGIRLIEERDRETIPELFMLAWQENGVGGLDPNAVPEVVDRAIKRDTFVIAVIDGNERIEAAIGFQPAKTWYGDIASWWWSELLVYVRPEHRRSRHFAKLMQFANWFADGVKAPVYISVCPLEDMDRKFDAFARHARKVGEVFLIGEGHFGYMEGATRQ